MGGVCPWWHGVGRGPSSQPKTIEELLDRCVVCPSGCWLFIGGDSGNGYGRILRPGTRNAMAAHRYVHEQFIGPIPPGFDVDHLCAGWVDQLAHLFLTRRCVRPEHLEARGGSRKSAAQIRTAGAADGAAGAEAHHRGGNRR